MSLQAITTPIDGLLVIEPQIFGDHRGWFLETWQNKKYSDIGINKTFVQDNMSFSRYNTLRGLHMQKPAQGKLVQVIQGSIFDVAVDLRVDSFTFGKWYGVTLSDENKKQFWIPEGFAHGFLVLSHTAIFSYKCTEYYNSKDEITIQWNDPDIGIEWPLEKIAGTLKKYPTLSDKDANAKRMSDYFDIHSL